MRTKTLKTLLVAAAVLFGATGCTDLVVEPESTVTGANIFKDESSYEQFLAKLYAGLALTGQSGPNGSGDIQRINDEGFSNYLRLLWVLNTLPTDEAVIGWGDPGLPEMSYGTWGADNQWPGGMYSRIYFQVAMANEFLRETTDEKLDARNVSAATRADIQTYRAEARFLRALSYWHGIDLFGGIPLVDESFPIGATPPEGATRSEVYQFIVDELNAIRSTLPAPGSGEYGRADQGAVAMLLAKVYLNAEVYTGTGAYTQALQEVQTVISAGAYSLDDEFLEVFLADNHTSPELIFTVPQDGLNTRTWGGTTFLAHAAVGGNMNASAYGLDFAWWGLRIQPEIVGLFPADGDARRDDVFFTDGQSMEIDELFNFFDGYAAPKYRNVDSNGNPGSNQTHVDADYVVFRLADAYLMYAEAHLRGGGGDAGTAVGYINQLRERAYGDASGNITAGELTLDFILDERARELYWEGHRRTDLVRFGLFSGGAYIWTYKGGNAAGGALPDYRDLYPIPASELLANPNLTQNPGY
ncbi:MAG: RagB/SusD family nutrient uptake outer membrane protein [Gemmatimonadales bacterium]|nr:MAG: RagB/SusD family nutrient uptake outer membrane protein [Gemmatimonadales bacterium]